MPKSEIPSAKMPRRILQFGILILAVSAVLAALPGCASSDTPRDPVEQKIYYNGWPWSKKDS